MEKQKPFNCNYLDWAYIQKPKRRNYNTGRATLYFCTSEQYPDSFAMPAEVRSIRVYKKKKGRLDWFALVTYRNGWIVCYDELAAYWKPDDQPLRYTYGGLQDGETGTGGPGIDVDGSFFGGNRIINHAPADYDPATYKPIPGVHLTPQVLRAVFKEAKEYRDKILLNRRGELMEGLITEEEFNKLA